MCPITLSLVAASVTTALTAAASAASAAAVAVAGAVTGAVTAVGGAISGVIAGATTAELVIAGVGTALGIAGAVYSYEKDKTESKKARKQANMTATAEVDQAYNEASRKQRVMAEEHTTDKFKSARLQGEVSNLQNRGSMQIAALTREVDRGKQQADSAMQAKLKGLSADVKQQTHRALLKEQHTLAANRGPGGGSLALGIGTAIVGGFAGLVGGAAGLAAQVGIQAAGQAPAMMGTPENPTYA